MVLKLHGVPMVALGLLKVLGFSTDPARVAKLFGFERKCVKGTLAQCESHSEREKLAAP